MSSRRGKNTPAKDKQATGGDEDEKSSALPVPGTGPEPEYFKGFSFEEFWQDDDECTSPPFTAKDVKDLEKKLRFTLPGSYIHLMKIRNGGHLQQKYTAHRAKKRTSWGPTHV